MKIDDIKIGQKVYWDDPDCGLCSGERTVASVTTDDSVVTFTDGTEAHPEECQPIYYIIKKLKPGDIIFDRTHNYTFEITSAINDFRFPAAEAFRDEQMANNALAAYIKQAYYDELEADEKEGYDTIEAGIAAIEESGLYYDKNRINYIVCSVLDDPDNPFDPKYIR